MTSAATIRGALGHANVRAFLRVIRERESGQADDAYTVINGGSHFPAPPWAHPWPEGTPTTQGGRAAGAYQFLPSTWKRLTERYPEDCADFSPGSQDFGAVALIAGRGALDDVIAGRIEAAVEKLRPEWTSLPGAAESSAGWTMDKARRCFVEFGGTLAGSDVPTQPAAPIEEAGTPAQPQEKPMVPILGALLPSIVEAIPALIAVFGKGERAKDNAKAAQVVADTVIKATNAVNLQEAVEKIQTDPSAKQAATAAVLAEPAIATLMEVGGGVEAARAANAKLMADADAWWKILLNPVLLVTVMVLPLVYVIVIELVRYMDKVSADVIAQTIGTVIGLVLGGVVGFWMGQTYQQTNRRTTDQAR